MLYPSTLIRRVFKNKEFKVIIITGDHGYGKSSYGNRILSEVYSEDDIHGNWKIEMFKRHLGFHPAIVTDQWLGMRKREIVYHWDDAGLWLNAMDYQDPFVIAVGKYLQVARTDWGCLIFSCIDRDDIFSKLRNLRTAIVVEITKEHTGKKDPHRRKASAYTYWKSRSGAKKGTRNLWEENFNCYVPGNYDPDHPEWVKNPSKEQKKDPCVTWGFHGWYEPRRDNYAYLAKQQMKHFLMAKHKELMGFKDKLGI